MSELEEGIRLALDFGKLAAVAATGAWVVPVVLQDADSSEVLFIGYANEEALEASLRERIAVLWSTSRNELWRKGSTSGDVLELAEIRVNCEQNSLLYLVRRTTGGACHTLLPSGSARPGCFYRTIAEGMTLQHLALLPGRCMKCAPAAFHDGSEPRQVARRTRLRSSGKIADLPADRPTANRADTDAHSIDSSPLPRHERPPTTPGHQPSHGRTRYPAHHLLSNAAQPAQGLLPVPGEPLVVRLAFWPGTETSAQKYA